MTINSFIGTRPCPFMLHCISDYFHTTVKGLNSHDRDVLRRAKPKMFTMWFVFFLQKSLAALCLRTLSATTGKALKQLQPIRLTILRIIWFALVLEVQPQLECSRNSPAVCCFVNKNL